MGKKLIATIVIVLVLGGVWYISSWKNQPGNQTSPTETGVKTFTLVEMAKHSDRTSCYTAIRGFVYDLTSWINQHPGGEQGILSICGIDGTSAFVSQHGGMERQERELEAFKIGELAK